MRTKELLFAGLVSTSIIGCHSDTKKEHDTAANSNNSASSYQAAKISLADQEKANPKKFVAITGITQRKNLLGEWVIEGKIANKATIISLKEVDMTVSFYSKNKKILGTKEIQVSDIISPGTELSFKAKTNGYKGAKTVEVVFKNVLVATTTEVKKAKDSAKSL